MLWRISACVGALNGFEITRVGGGRFDACVALLEVWMGVVLCVSIVYFWRVRMSRYHWLFVQIGKRIRGAWEGGM